MQFSNVTFRLCISLFFCFFHIIAQEVAFVNDDPSLLTVVIMIKDEVDVIIPTLQPFVSAGVVRFLVLDTGSMDGTQQKVRDYFRENNIYHGYVIEEPFIDFATSRNRALDLAESIFVDSTFLLMLDAEWYIHNVDELLRYCKEHKDYIAPNCSGSCYLMRLFTVQDCINNYTPRLIRRGYNIRYVGPVHESILDAASGIVPDAVFFEYNPREYGQKKSKDRFARDYALLKKNHDNDPYNMRTLFYLGQTCQFLGDWEQSIYFYQKRADIGELSEEKYLAIYRIGCAIEHILENASQNNIPSSYTWEDAFRYYLQAYMMLPYRAEPLFRIACHYIRENQHAIAYLFALRAAQLPYPYYNGLFIEKRVYDHLRYDILGQCALYVGEYEVGKAAVLRAMQVAPDDECLRHNLAVYDHYISAQNA